MESDGEITGGTVLRQFFDPATELDEWGPRGEVGYRTGHVSKHGFVPSALMPAWMSEETIHAPEGYGASDDSADFTIG